MFLFSLFLLAAPLSITDSWETAEKNQTDSKATANIADMIDSIKQHLTADDSQSDCAKKKTAALEQLANKLSQSKQELENALKKGDKDKQARHSAKIEFISLKADQIFKDSATCFSDSTSNSNLLSETPAEKALRDHTPVSGAATSAPVTPVAASIAASPTT